MAKNKVLSCLVVVLLILPLLTSCIPIYASENPSISTDLRGWWKFNEGSGNVLYDYSPYSNHGTINNPIWQPRGKYNYCLFFDNVSSYVSIPDSSSLDISGALTIVVWVKPVEVVTRQAIIAKANASAYYGEGWWLALNYKSILFEAKYGGVWSSSQTGDYLAAGRWSCIAVTHDTSGYTKIYHNGILVKTDWFSGSIELTDRPVTIGTDYNLENSKDMFHGKIDNVRIWARTLTNSQVYAESYDPPSTILPEEHVAYSDEQPYTGSPFLGDPYSRLSFTAFGYPFGWYNNFLCKDIGVKGQKYINFDGYPTPELGCYDTVTTYYSKVNQPTSADSGNATFLTMNGKPIPIVLFNTTMDDKEYLITSFEWNETIFHKINLVYTENPINLLYHMKFRLGNSSIDSTESPYVIVYKHNCTEHSEDLWIAITYTYTDSYYTDDIEQTWRETEGAFNGTTGDSVTNQDLFVGLGAHSITSGQTIYIVLALSEVSSDDAVSKARTAVVNFNNAFEECKAFWNDINDEIVIPDEIPIPFHYYIYVACQQILAQSYYVDTDKLFLPAGAFVWNRNFIRDTARTVEGLVYFMPNKSIEMLNFFEDVTEFSSANSYDMWFEPDTGSATDFGAVFIQALYEVYKASDDEAIIESLQGRINDVYDWLLSHLTSDKKHVLAVHPHDFWDDYSEITAAVTKGYESLIDVLWADAANKMSVLFSILNENAKAQNCISIYNSLQSGLSLYLDSHYGLWYAQDVNGSIAEIYTSEANIKRANYLLYSKSYSWLLRNIEQFDYENVIPQSIIFFDESSVSFGWTPHLNEVSVIELLLYQSNKTIISLLEASRLGIQREGLGEAEMKYAIWGDGVGGAESFSWSYGSFLWALQYGYVDPLYKNPYPSELSWYFPDSNTDFSFDFSTSFSSFVYNTNNISFVNLTNIQNDAMRPTFGIHSNKDTQITDMSMKKLVLNVFGSGATTINLYGFDDLGEPYDVDGANCVFNEDNGEIILTTTINGNKIITLTWSPEPPAPPPIYVRDAYNITYYFRSDTHTVHEILGYILGLSNTRSEIIDSRSSSATEPVSYGVRVWVVDMFSQQHELTSGSPAVLITLNSPASGMQIGTWLCPKYSNIIDSLLIKVYQRFGNDPWNLRRIYVSDDHLYYKLPNATWTFYLWLNMTQGSTYSDFGFGDYDVYNSRVTFQYYKISPWELGFVRLYARDFYGFIFTPWTYFLGDVFWSLLLFALCISFYLRYGSWKPVLALLWILGGSGSILWALIPAINLHIAVVMLALAMSTTLYKVLR